MSPVRSGAALIIAISVLAALLLLALPFVFSQTASMAGAQAAAWGGTAGRGRGSAEQTATAAAVYVNAWHLTNVLTTNTPPALARAYSALPEALAAITAAKGQLAQLEADSAGKVPWWSVAGGVLLTLAPRLLGALFPPAKPLAELAADLLWKATATRRQKQADTPPAPKV